MTLFADTNNAKIHFTISQLLESVELEVEFNQTKETIFLALSGVSMNHIKATL
jgi:hypothetical protein